MKRQRRIASNTQEENEEEEEALHLSRKERQKAAKVAEREERKLFEQERRQQQYEAQEAAKLEKKKRERLEAQRLEKERQMRLEAKNSQREAEYRKWNTFLASEERTMTVHEFVEYAKQQKIVSIDNLAEDYQRPSHQVQKRIQKLVDSCRLTGIIDGDKFIYMTNEELTLLANYILEREEVSLQELAKSTGSLIKL
jgi:hypothetical protein